MAVQKKNEDNPILKMVHSLFRNLTIEEINRAKQITGRGALTKEEREQLASLTTQKLTEEAALASSTVSLWQYNETAAATARIIEDEELKRRKGPLEGTLLQ